MHTNLTMGDVLAMGPAQAGAMRDEVQKQLNAAEEARWKHTEVLAKAAGATLR